MEKIKNKLMSRKLWLALAGVVVGIATVLGVDGGDISTVAGAIVSLASVVSYIITEGRIDAAAVGAAAGAVQDAIDVLVEPEVDPEAMPPANAAATLAAVTAALKSSGVKV